MSSNNVGDVPAWIAPLKVPVPLPEAEALVVRPASVRQIVQLLAVAAPVVRAVMALPPDMLDRLKSEQGPTGDDITDLFEVLSDKPDALLKAVAIATDLPDQVVGDLLPDQFAYLFAVVVQVNADFFFRATSVFGAAGRVLSQIQASRRESGSAPSGS